jgi:hypothetical protein
MAYRVNAHIVANTCFIGKEAYNVKSLLKATAASFEYLSSILCMCKEKGAYFNVE